MIRKQFYNKLLVINNFYVPLHRKIQNRTKFKTERMNIGKHIEEIMRKQGKSAAWLATQIPCERTNVYNIFKRKSLDVRLLMRISVILQHDFFMELSHEAFPKAK